MRKEEAEYIGNSIRQLGQEFGGPVLNVGSSTRNFRENIQKHVNEKIFLPLKSDAVKVIHTDLKDADGVDISGDLLDVNVQKELACLHPRIILASNLLEHLPLEVRDRFPAALDTILANDGFLILTVPYSYPLHFDPIDTYFRPSPDELAALFPRYQVIDKQVITSTNYYQDLKKYSFSTILRILGRLVMPFYKPKSWIGVAHRFLWLFKPYKVSYVLLKKSTN
ncbi:MAG: hypothetical protein OEZ39_09410 [Gammaproteobacteria bacterium]|nr:hypothetical protein [Gammaproteobacteria bacterium]MDH5652061.1 hypothetical protein [Gammaproteobacteria bacterium]